MMNKKFMLALCATAVGSFSAFADEPATLETVLGNVQTAMTGYVTTALPIIGTVVVAGLGIWALPKIVGWIKRGFSRT